MDERITVVDESVKMDKSCHEKNVLEFISRKGLPECKKRMRKLLAMSSESFSVFKLNADIASFCKEMDLESAYSLYVQSKSKNVFPSQNVYASLLSLTAGFGEQGSGLGPIREVEPPSDFEAAYNVFCDMREKKINFVESMYTAMIRCFCINDRLNEALCLYEEMLSKNVQPKLRTYNPLLKIGASSQNIDLCFRLYREMTENFRLVPSEKEYNSMLSITTSKRDQRFYEILNTMSQDIYIPSVNTWDIVKVWFSQLSDPYVCTTSTISTSGKVEVNGDILLSLDLDENTRQELLTQIESLATSDSALVSERSLLDISMNDKHDISLYHTEVNPDSLEFNKDPVTCESILKTTLVDTQHDVKDTSHLNQDVSEYTGVIKKGRKYFKTISSIARIRHFSEFKAWTEKAKLENDELIGSTSSHNQWKYNVIVDGANVGYYKQNYISAPGHVDYHQIDWMLRHLKYLGFRPLLILHCRHLNVQSLNLPTSTISMIESWKKSDMLYVTPSGCNDDWYWLYCAVYFRCKSVTNDEMRDHHFQMLSPRWFENWKERNQIHFTFGDWTEIPLDIKRQDSILIDDTCVPEKVYDSDDDSNDSNPSKRFKTNEKVMKWRAPILQIPLPYSHRMQCIDPDSNICKPNVEVNLQLAGKRFYFPPVDDKSDISSLPEEYAHSNKWLCIYKTIT